MYADRIDRLIEADYRAALRRFFLPEDLKKLVSGGQRIWWRLLNLEPAEEAPLETLVKRCQDRGITLVLGRQEASNTLLGFYLPKTAGFRRPLIWLDTTVKHRALLGATYIHELGHHVVSQVLGRGRGTVHRSCAEDLDRLDNRDEIAADLFVSMSVIPYPTAMAMFRGAGEGSQNLRRQHRKMCERYGIAINARNESDEDLTCLIGSLHYIKLREALLTEFGV